MSTSGLSLHILVASSLPVLPPTTCGRVTMSGSHCVTTFASLDSLRAASIIHCRQIDTHLRGRVKSPTGGKVGLGPTEPASRSGGRSGDDGVASLSYWWGTAI